MSRYLGRNGKQKQNSVFHVLHMLFERYSNLPESLALLKLPLMVGVVDPVRGGRHGGDGGRAHDGGSQHYDD